jgi:hypothetical protein
MFNPYLLVIFSLPGCTYVLSLILTRKMRRQADHGWKTMFLPSYLERGVGDDL